MQPYEHTPEGDGRRTSSGSKNILPIIVAAAAVGGVVAALCAALVILAVRRRKRSREEESVTVSFGHRPTAHVAPNSSETRKLHTVVYTNTRPKQRFTFCTYSFILPHKESFCLLRLI